MYLETPICSSILVVTCFLVGDYRNNNHNNNNNNHKLKMDPPKNELHGSLQVSTAGTNPGHPTDRRPGELRTQDLHNASDVEGNILQAVECGPRKVLGSLSRAPLKGI